MATLQDILRSKIAVDTRPRSQMDLFQAGSGRKRTTIVGATVKSVTQAQVDNQGATTWGVLKQQPMTRGMFRQGPLFDCYILASAIALTLDDPNWCDDIILPVDARTVIVQYYFRGEIVQITTSLEVSTSYNNPSDDDVRVELLEKTYGFLRSGISDYLKANWGNGIEALQAFGRQVVTVTNRTPANIDLMRSQKKALVAITGINATTVTARHALCVLDHDTYIDPWDGATDRHLPAPTLASNAEIPAIYVGTTPSPKVLVKPAPPPAPPPVIVPRPDPMPPAVPISPAPTPAPAPAPVPEKPMALDLDISTNLGVNLFDAKAEASIDVQAGRVADIQWTSNADSVTVHNSLWNSTTTGSAKDKTMFSVGGSTVLTFTATRGAERLVKKLTINSTLTPPVSPSPTPAPTPTKKAKFVLYEDGTWGAA